MFNSLTQSIGAYGGVHITLKLISLRCSLWTEVPIQGFIKVHKFHVTYLYHFFCLFDSKYNFLNCSALTISLDGVLWVFFIIPCVTMTNVSDSLSQNEKSLYAVLLKSVRNSHISVPSSFLKSSTLRSPFWTRLMFERIFSLTFDGSDLMKLSASILSISLKTVFSSIILFSASKNK